uniref:Thioredoxin domain-containing protein n=1 Tax=Coccolithus braarudii TaxID=221442 RepID=A0A7S0LTD1_9EUKA|mmetsp:Transcript_9464/g.20608  ORF Transcript_9464/g.20608 Transcript_9464/m.20608 type:complete len:174 (+) Transcript_9464:200-721(+)
MKPDWDSLASDYAESKTVLIADVDCTTAGKPLCEKYGVRGYPTIKFFNPPDEEGEDYKGGRSLADLKKFCETELGPGCSVDTIENCSEEQKTALEAYIAMPNEERASMLETLKEELKAAESKHEALLKELQSTYKESMDTLEKLKEESAPKIKLLKAATPSPAAAAEPAKDEV